MQSYHDNLILQFDDVITGNAASNQLVTVFNAGTAVKPALFDVFGSPIANPVTTDSKGNYSFSIADGTYDIVARQGTPDETRRDEFIISVPGSTNAVKSFDTLAEAIADIGLVDGDTFKLTADRGNSDWNVVLKASVIISVGAPSIGNIVASTGDITLAFVLEDSYGVLALARPEANAKHWGYIADGVTAGQDVVIQLIIDTSTSLFNDSGVTIDLGGGTAIWSAELLITLPNVRFVGTGKRNVYLAESAVSQPIRPSASSPTTVIGIHTDRNLIRIFRTKSIAEFNEAGTFSSQGVSFATLETGNRPTACFGFDASGDFHRDYSFQQCGMFGFSAVFDMYDDSGVGVKQFASLKVVDCNINRNGHIAINRDNTQWNGFLFQRNEAGQNGIGLAAGVPVMDVRGQNVVINGGNLLEGQPNTIRVSGNFKGLIIEGNYFEGNSGDFVIDLISTLGSKIGPNFYNAITATHDVKLSFLVSPVVNEGSDINVFYDGCTNVTDSNNVLGLPRDSDAFNGGSVMMPFSKIAKHEKRSGDKVPLFFQVVAPEQKFNNIDDSAGAQFTSAGVGSIIRTAASKTYVAGDIICAVAIVSYDDLPVIDPRLLLNINGSTDGASPGIFANFNKGKLDFKNRTFVMFSFAKALVSNTANITASLSPFGLNPVAGLKATFTTWIWNLGQDFDSIEPFVCSEMYDRAGVVPIVGDFFAGDTLKKSKGLSFVGDNSKFICIISSIASNGGSWAVTDEVFEFATTAELEDITNVINTSSNKVEGRPVLNTTTDITVIAAGNANGSLWVFQGTGNTAHTPV
jgi:hypothetical protein